jgi:pantothenate kinase-related protein Tda10
MTTARVDLTTDEIIDDNNNNSYDAKIPILKRRAASAASGGGNNIKDPICVIVVGMAGSGKTTLMSQLQKSLSLRDDNNGSGDNDEVSFWCGCWRNNVFCYVYKFM